MSTAQSTLPNIDAFADTFAQPVLSYFDDVADDWAAELPALAAAPADEADEADDDTDTETLF